MKYFCFFSHNGWFFALNL